jgi:hypothetical protein
MLNRQKPRPEAMLSKFIYSIESSRPNSQDPQHSLELLIVYLTDLPGSIPSILNRASPLSSPDSEAPLKTLRLFLSIPAKIEMRPNPLSIGVDVISMLANIVAKAKRG